MPDPNDKAVPGITDSPIVKFGQAVAGAPAGMARAADKIGKTVSNQPNSLRKRAKSLLGKI